ncbi:RNA polymerase sigma factor [Sporosarcina sp. Te-1]|uniref:RNA polymerase sigma factor n=1 Tax=Sporosarcina sp. Te-1 TaxID=2818390 RepID=UPI001A9E4CA0|nr:sigma-70 family RNA polymerase sigma factor [Sporosarcina sp. Te-1]QTD43121.1 sigma-70 family RNA polymerase sigma factor [Sporosarcina sp. Te-1]
MKPIAKWVKKAKKGDGDAFILLVKQYEDVLFRAATRMLRDEQDVADVLQDTIMTAYEKIHTLKRNEYFNTWIYKILLNQCNRLLAKRNKVVSLDEHTLQGQDDGNFRAIELADALDGLAPDTKTVFTLYYIVGMNSREISEFLNEPEGTIKSRLSRGRNELRTTYFQNEGVLVNEKGS